VPYQPVSAGVSPAGPLVSVLVAARDAESTIREALEAVYAQTLADFEVVLVDDGSVDRTAEIATALDDPRLVIVANSEPLGLAGALNRGLDVVRGRYVARMDADDVALPIWLERLVARITTDPPVAVVGTGMIDLAADGALGATHPMPVGSTAVRFASLFSSPFFHSTVLLDKAIFDQHDLRYDTSFGESEDYDLWARLLTVADGDNVLESLVLYRKHPTQASARRAELQRECQRRVALRQIGELAPTLEPNRAELAWLLGSGHTLPADKLRSAAKAYVELVDAFEARYPTGVASRIAARTLARAASRGEHRTALLRQALELDPALPARLPTHLGERRRRRRESSVVEQRRTRATTGGAPIRLTMVFPEPTPFRTVMLDRVARRPELELTVLYAGSSVQRRTWTIEPEHRAVFLEGRRVPGLYRALRHEYPISTEIFGALRESRPDGVVVSGWSTFASQAAAAWCRRSGVSYALLAESNDRDARPGWRRLVKGSVVGPMLRGAAQVLVVGRLARESMIARGADPERISLFADTIDVTSFGRETDRLMPDREAMRLEMGLAPEDIAVLSVARLAPEKGLDTLVDAIAAAADRRLVLVLAGSGAERETLQARATRLGVRLIILPDIPWERIVERFVIADIFALLSRHEPWGVVVNEAAACGLPLVLSDRVGAAFDLLDDGVNGRLVPVDDARATAEAIRWLAADPSTRHAAGAASRELMKAWGYEPSIENLIQAGRLLARSPGSASASR
jgi:glycosyltransferase involved in cell wall biosynthesis